MKLSTYLLIMVLVVLITAGLRIFIEQEPMSLLYRLPMYLFVYLFLCLSANGRTIMLVIITSVLVAIIETVDLIWGDGQQIRIVIIVLHCLLVLLLYKYVVKVLKYKKV